MSRYLKGVDVLGAGRPSAGEEVVGANWAAVLYNPAGIAYDYYSPGSARSANLAAAANPYWAQQRAAVGPIATGNAARVQAAQAMQAQLRAQQAAQIAAMRAQAASLPSTPPSTMPPSAPSTSPPATSDPGSGGQPDSSAPSTDDSSASVDSSVVGAAGEQFVVIHINNVGELLEKALGKTASDRAMEYLPTTVNDLVYSKMRDQLKSKLSEQGVDADVIVTAMPPTGAPPESEFLTSAMIGAGAVGVGWAAWHYVLRGIFFKGKR